MLLLDDDSCDECIICFKRDAKPVVHLVIVKSDHSTWLPRGRTIILDQVSTSSNANSNL